MHGMYTSLWYSFSIGRQIVVPRLNPLVLNKSFPVGVGEQDKRQRLAPSLVPVLASATFSRLGAQLLL